MDRSEAILRMSQTMDVDLRLEAKQHLWWSNVTGDVEYVEGMSNDTMKPSGQIIDRSTKISKTQFGDAIFIPMEMQLSGEGKMGRATLIGSEEPACRKVAAVHWNRRRHAVILEDSEVDTMLERPWEVQGKRKTELAYWFSQMQDWDITTALLEGLSEHLTAAKTSGGSEIAKRYHPNFYTYLGSSATNGTLTRIGTAGKFPTAAQVYAAAVQSVGGATYGTFTSYTVEAMWEKVQELNIKQCMDINGFKFWVCLLSNKQARTLRADTNFKDAQKTLIWTEAAKNPLFNGSIGYYNGFVFFNNLRTPRGVYSGDAGTTIDFLGTATQASSDIKKSNPRFLPMSGNLAATTTTSVYNHIAVVLGAGALGFADYDELGFRKELIDYGDWQGLGAKHTYGYERMDYIRADQANIIETAAGVTAATDIYNQSSMLVMTWQPA